MIGKSLVDELSEDRENDEKIIKSFYSKTSLSLDIFEKSSGTYKMIDPVRDGLLTIADKFIDFLGVEFFIYDVVLTGSLANYNWSEFSDIDIHIIIDYDESNYNNTLLQEFFNAKKNLWNASHDIKIKNYEVEIYVQDTKEKHISSGVYSILNNEWVIEPQKEKKMIDDRAILEKGEEYAKLIDKLIEKKENGEDIRTEIGDVKKKLKRFRQSGLDHGGEYSYENLTFKLLRRNGYIEKLMDVKKDSIDSKLSINELTTSAILLRKLTLKSVINFGKLKGHTVEDILRLGHNAYLRYLYYNIDGITFIDDILNLIGIRDDEKIQKPGTNPELGKEISEKRSKRLNLQMRSHNKRVKKAKEIGKYISDRAGYTKGNLQRWNQGKK